MRVAFLLTFVSGIQRDSATDWIACAYPRAYDSVTIQRPIELYFMRRLITGLMTSLRMQLARRCILNVVAGWSRKQALAFLSVVDMLFNKLLGF